MQHFCSEVIFSFGHQRQVCCHLRVCVCVWSPHSRFLSREFPSASTLEAPNAGRRKTNDGSRSGSTGRQTKRRSVGEKTEEREGGQGPPHSATGKTAINNLHHLSLCAPLDHSANSSRNLRQKHTRWLARRPPPPPPPRHRHAGRRAFTCTARRSHASGCPASAQEEGGLIPRSAGVVRGLLLLLRSDPRRPRALRVPAFVSAASMLN